MDWVSQVHLRFYEFFQRCDSGGALGFATSPMCYQVDANNLGNNMPWIAP